MDNFKDSRVVHGPKIQRNFPRALLVDHLHDRWAAWVMEAKKKMRFFFPRGLGMCIHIWGTYIHITYKMSFITI